MNAAVIQGSAVTFECSSDVNDSVLYWYNSLCVTTSSSIGTCRDNLIHNGNVFISSLGQRSNVTKVNSDTLVTRDLNINSAQLTDAGVYLCVEFKPGFGVLDSSSAQLIVLGKLAIL